MARSRPGARRTPAAGASAHRSPTSSSFDSSPSAPSGASERLSGAPERPSLASATLPRVWQGVGYRPLPDAAAARPLFDFAAVPWPITGASSRLADDAHAELAWGAFTSEGLIGATVGERAGDSVMLHGPVVNAVIVAGASSHLTTPVDDPLEVAAQLVAASMDHARALGVVTIFTRPHGLDRIWVRFGFIPVPEMALPEALTGRPGAGLYAWRGDSALWSFRERREDAPVRREDAPARRATVPDVNA